MRSLDPLSPIEARRFPHFLVGLALVALALAGLTSCLGGEGDNDVPGAVPGWFEPCEPDCAGRCCGSDGCGGVCEDSCGESGQTCDEDSCECADACVPLSCSELGVECGSWPDGCDGTVDCGSCPDDGTCDENGVCEWCEPDCTDLCSGPDGCGGTCPDLCAEAEGFCDLSTNQCEAVCDYQMTPTTSFRRLDTRSDAKLQAGVDNSFVMAGRDGIPATAQAVIVRFTVVAPEAVGHIIAFNTGTSASTTSVLNYVEAQTTGNMFWVKVGTEGKITVRSTAETHLIIDVFGYTEGTEAFAAQDPYRLIDTRTTSTPAADSTTCWTVAGVNGVSADAKAVAVVVTAVSPDADGSAVVFAGDASAPSTDSLSFSEGQTAANGTMVPIGADQRICLHTTARSDFLVDVSGYFEANAAYQTVPPFRALDATPTSDSTSCYQLAGVEGIPADAQAVAFNLTAVTPAEPGYVTAFPSGTQQPVSSSLNYAVGRTITSGVISKIGDDGEVCLYAHSSAELLLDVVGYWPSMDSCCDGVTCESPPFIGCSGTTDLITYGASGACSNGTCDYTHAVTTCDYLCQDDACIPAPIPTTTFGYHDRTAWQDSSYPVSSSTWMQIGALDYITLHYIGADGVAVSDVAQLLRNAQWDYVVNRGYSLGYNSAVSLDGDEWEIRGFDYRCAANGSPALNLPGYAILLVLPNTWSAPSQDQIDGVRSVVGKIRDTAAAAGNFNYLEINGHQDLLPTSCPGSGIYNLIQSGAFEP